MGINPELMQLAKMRLQPELFGKKAAVPAQDPAAMGMDPAAMGGAAPPMDPAMMGAAPPMDPSMMGGAPPMDPAMMGAAPFMDPAMMGAAAPAAPAAPPAAPAVPAANGGQKMKPEQMMQQLSYQLYFIQQQLTALMNGLNVQLPPGALVLPPGVGGPPSPVAALPGGPLDPSQQQGAAPPAEQSAIQPIEPMQAAMPQKQAFDATAREFLDEAQANAPLGYRVLLVKESESASMKPCDDEDVIKSRTNFSVPRKTEDDDEGSSATSNPPTNKIAALAAMLRGKSAR